jgi:flagellar biogenesis protein FliO
MKNSYLKLLMFALLVLAPAAAGLAQNSNTNTAPAQNEAMTENDRLPFMQSEETAAPREPTSGGLLLKTLGSMLLIVGLIFFGAWGAKKLGFGGVKGSTVDGDPALSVISSVSLGNGRTISMVRFGERMLVVGSTPQSFTLLAEEMPAESAQFQNSRSVADMLAEEEGLFATEFDRAGNVMSENEGGPI